jgi:hypothetical protein
MKSPDHELLGVKAEPCPCVPPTPGPALCGQLLAQWVTEVAGELIHPTALCRVDAPLFGLLFLVCCLSVCSWRRGGVRALFVFALLTFSGLFVCLSHLFGFWGGEESLNHTFYSFSISRVLLQRPLAAAWWGKTGFYQDPETMTSLNKGPSVFLTFSAPGVSIPLASPSGSTPDGEPGGVPFS